MAQESHISARPGERHKRHGQHLACFDLPRVIFVHQHQILREKRSPDRNDHTAAWFELPEERWRDVAGRRGDDDGVKWRVLFPTIIPSPARVVVFI